MTHAQWQQLSNHAWLSHHEVQYAIERNRTGIQRAIACASRAHRKRSHLERRLVMAKVAQLQQELSCQ